MLRLSPRPPKDLAAGRTAPKRRKSAADPNQPPFSSFMERDHARRARQRGRRRTLVVSIAVHAVVLGGLLAYSLFQVEELWSPSVEVKVFRADKLPAGVTPLPRTPPEATVTPR